MNKLAGGICKFTSKPCRSAAQVSNLARYILVTSESDKLGRWMMGMGRGSETRSDGENISHFARLAEILAEANSHKQTSGQLRLADHLVVTLGDPENLDEERLRKIAVAIHKSTILRDHPTICGAHRERNREGLPYAALHFQIANHGLNGRSLAAQRNNRELHRLYKQVHTILVRHGIILDESTHGLNPISKSTPPPKRNLARWGRVRDEIVKNTEIAATKSRSALAFRTALVPAGLTCRFYRTRDGLARCAVSVPSSKFVFRTDRMEALSPGATKKIHAFAEEFLQRRELRPRMAAHLRGRTASELAASGKIFAVTTKSGFRHDGEAYAPSRALMGIKVDDNRVLFLDASRYGLEDVHSGLIAHQSEQKAMRDVIRTAVWLTRLLGWSMEVMFKTMAYGMRRFPQRDWLSSRDWAAGYGGRGR